MASRPLAARASMRVEALEVGAGRFASVAVLVANSKLSLLPRGTLYFGPPVCYKEINVNTNNNTR